MSEIVSSIRVLDASEWRVLKEITLLGQIGKGTKELEAILLYTRPLTPEYKPKECHDASSFEMRVHGRKQEDYPNDWFDEMILDAVKAQFPQSKVRSDLILFDAVLERVERQKNKGVVATTILVSPDFQGVDPWANEGREFKRYSLALNVYTMYPTEEILQNLQFYADYSTSEEELVGVLASVKFE